MMIGGRGLSTSQRQAVNKITGLQATAAEIDNIILDRQSVLPKNLIDSGVSVLDVGTVTGITVDVGTAVLNSTVTPFGSSSITLASASAGANAAFHKSALGFSLTSIDSASAFIKLNTGYSTFSQIKLVFGAGTYAQYKQATAVLKTKVQAVTGAWNNVLCGMSEFTFSGGMSITDEITYVQVIVTAAAGQTPSIEVGGIYIDLKSRPAIAFSFDDGNESDYTIAYQALKKYGFSAISFIISDDVGQLVNGGLDQRLSLTQMQEMYNNGWDFGIHGKTYQNWTSLSLADAETSIKTCRNWLYTNGFKRTLDFCAYPENEYNDDIVAILKRYGINYARTTHEFPQFSPVESFMKIKLGFPLQQTLQGNIDLLEARIKNGGLVNIYGHKLSDSGAYPSTAVFNDFVSYINTNYRRYVTTIPKWVEDYKTGAIL